MVRGIMDLGLKGLRVLVAGSSRGLGLAIAKAFFSEGANVWLTGREEESLKQAAGLLNNALITCCDLTKDIGRQFWLSEVSQTWGNADLLILNVGSGKASHMGIDTPQSEWTRILDLNFMTHVNLIHDFRALLQKSKVAAIVGVSSIAGQMRLPAPVAYSVAKAALDHFCTVSCDELARSGIRFNLVSPGNILAPGGSWDIRLKTDKDKVLEYINCSVPLKRFATPEEIAAGVLFLASPQSAFCTGSILRMDGGQML